MRLSEIITLKRHQVNLDARVVTLIFTKNKDTRQVPLTSRAVELFQQLPKPEGSDHPLHVLFDLKAETATSLFIKARNRASFPDVNFHDSRSEGLTRLSKIFDVMELARIVGHKSPASLMFYYAPSIEELAQKLD